MHKVQEDLLKVKLNSERRVWGRWSGEGWEIVKNTGCSCGGPEFISQHLLGSSQPSFNFSSRGFDALLWLCGHRET